MCISDTKKATPDGVALIETSITNYYPSSKALAPATISRISVVIAA